MGQRTCILLKKNFGNNRSTITLIHHQWGIGKVMPALFLQEVMKLSYPLNRSLEYFYERDLQETGKLPIDYFFTFEPLSNPNSNYITDKEVATDDPDEDIWKPEVRIRYGNMTDNNNGMMLVEVTQNYKENFKGEVGVVTYGNMLSIKVGFALGNEETYIYHPHLKHGIDLELPFARLVSMEEFVCRTHGENNPKVQKYSKKFVKACRTIMQLEDIEEVYDKEGAKKRTEYEQHVKNCLDELTKDLPDRMEIETPMEFQQTPLMYS